MFTHRLIVAILKLLASAGAAALLQWLHRLVGLPVNPLHITSGFQLLLDTAFGLMTVGAAVAAIYFGLVVFSLLLTAYEAGAKVLNEREENKDPK